MPRSTSIGYLYAGGEGTRVRGMKGHLPERKPNTEGHILCTYLYVSGVYIIMSCCCCTPINAYCVYLRRRQCRWRADGMINSRVHGGKFPARLGMINRGEEGRVVLKVLSHRNQSTYIIRRDMLCCRQVRLGFLTDVSNRSCAPVHVKL